jgi:hypothetical protein
MPSLLLFTNIGAAGWDADTENRIIRSFSRYDRVVLDLRLFGSVREGSTQREELRARISDLVPCSIESMGMEPLGAFYVMVVPEHVSANRPQAKELEKHVQ